MIASTDFMHTLAWSLLHFLWQATAIAAFAAAVMFVFRKPGTRYLVGVAALGLMLVSFGVTFSLLSGSAGSTVASFAAGAPAAASPSTLEASAFSVPQVMEQQAATLDFVWVARGWIVGVFFFGLRIAFGLLFIEHLRRRNLVALTDTLVARFSALQQRLGISRAIRYCECRLLAVPAVIGFFRPIVLLPVRALTGLTPEQLEAVIAHELGHIKRFDVAVNFFQVVAETLFFFHPAVWWLNRRIRADREDCCDDIAIAACGGTVCYARALATMEGWRDVPSFATAATGSPVAVRIARLLGVHDKTGTRTAGVFAASLVLVAALLGGAVAIGASQPEPVASPDPVAAPEPMSAPDPAAAPAPVAPPAPAAAPKPPRPAKRANPASPASPANPAQPASPTSYIDELNSVGVVNVDVDTLIQLRVHGVSAEYIRGMRATGFNPDVEQLVAMRVQGVTPEYVKEIRSMGFTPDVDELIALKTQDVSAEYVNGIRSLGFKPNTDEIVAMKVQGITPEYVKEMRAAGFNPDTDELIALKVQGVTPEYRSALEAAGYKMDVDQLITAKVMDITPEFIAKVGAHGFKNLNIDQLINLKNANVF